MDRKGEAYTRTVVCLCLHFLWWSRQGLKLAFAATHAMMGHGCIVLQPPLAATHVTMQAPSFLRT
eukprot:779744-Amphidinium_carterae.1